MAARIKPTIELPKPKKGKKPSIEFFDPRELLKRYDKQTNLIIAVLIVAFITMMIMTATLVIDSFHINSTVYREYSQKTEINNTLLEENKYNQKTIIENQKLIQELLKQKIK